MVTKGSRRTSTGRRQAVAAHPFLQASMSGVLPLHPGWFRQNCLAYISPRLCSAAFHTAASTSRCPWSAQTMKAYRIVSTFHEAVVAHAGGKTCGTHGCTGTGKGGGGSAPTDLPRAWPAMTGP